MIKNKETDKNCAVRHLIRVKKHDVASVSSHTGRDMSSTFNFYPHTIPNGILTQINKELAI